MNKKVVQRWHVVDELGENNLSETPYCYVGSNPVGRIDPDGKDWIAAVIGFASAVADNIYPGLNSAEKAPPVDIAHFNIGQKVGQAASIIIGAEEIATGGGMMAAGGLGTVLSGGAASGVSVPAITGGAAVAGHGLTMMSRGAANLMTGNGQKQNNTTKQEHGNKLNDTPAEQYSLKNKKGDVQKYGETTRGEDKFGPGNQKRYTKAELEKKGLTYEKESSGTKKEMHKVQTDKIKKYKEENNGNRPPLNKTDY